MPKKLFFLFFRESEGIHNTILSFLVFYARLFFVHNFPQVEENMKAIEVVEQLTDDVMEKIEGILDNKPDPMEFQQ